MIGDIQEFEMFCGADVEGIEVDRMPLSSHSAWLALVCDMNRLCHFFGQVLARVANKEK